MKDKERVISFCLKQIEECCEIIGTLTKQPTLDKNMRRKYCIMPTFYTKAEGEDPQPWYDGEVMYDDLVELRANKSIIFNGNVVHSFYFNKEGKEPIRWDCINGFTNGAENIGSKLERIPEI